MRPTGGHWPFGAPRPAGREGAPRPVVREGRPLGGYASLSRSLASTMR
ncbi:hypothetical protein SUDANB99_02546 [Streptomyces sp. enrichment culture]